MATIGTDSNGRKRILFVAGDGTRKTIRLGKATMKQAEALKVKVESLVSANITGNMDDEISRWLATLPEAIHDRLASVGLIALRQSVKLGTFIDRYIVDRHDVKPATATVFGHTRRNLVSFFGADKPLREITPGDADRWRTVHLIGEEKLSPNTMRRRCGIAKQFFRAAMRRKLITSNPFEDLKAGVQANKSRDYFLNPLDSSKVLEACPNAEWRLIFALARYGGLRCPSEILRLRWSDVDWSNGRILVHSPKTEHHHGGESRLVPLFPEFEPHLLAVHAEAVEGGEYVITRYRDAGVNLRTHLERIIKRAGLKPWPKLFQNLRSTRETELAEQFPEHVVCAWIGNSRLVARKHYLQLTDDHFEQARTGGSHAKGAAQYTAVPTLPEQKPLIPEKQKSPELPGDSQRYHLLYNDLVGDTGSEQCIVFC